MLRLAELDATFVRHEVRIERIRRVKPELWLAVQARGGVPAADELEELDAPVTYHVPVPTLAEADGVSYLCPKCFTCNRGSVGTHGVLNWFVGHVADDVTPTGGRWIPRGELDALTFIGPSSASVLLTSGCGAHFYVKNGGIEPIGVWVPGDDPGARPKPRPRGRR